MPTGHAGSHLTQSQSASESSEARTAIARCSGDWNAAAEQIIARARARACSSAPQSSIRPKARRSTAAGRFGCTRCTSSSRCSAEAAAGSTWSIGARVGRHELERQRPAAHAVPHLEELSVGDRVLPDPRPFVGERGQGRRLGVLPEHGNTLLGGRVAGDPPDRAEVAEVLGAGAGDGPGALLPLPVELDDDEAERGEQEHARGHEAASLPAGRGAAHRRDEHDRAEAAEHRDRVHQHAAGVLRGWEEGRRTECDLPVGRRG